MTGIPLYHRFIIIVLAFCLQLNSIEAQNERLSRSTYSTLNNYIVYSNEVVHAINLMYFDFLLLNKQFFAYVEDSISTVTYSKDNILTNYEYFPVFPRDLYPNLSDNIYIPYDKRGEPLQLIGKVANVLKEIENARTRLNRYINSGSYKSDTNLVQGFTILRRVEVLYYDMFTLQEKLHWNLSSIIQSFDQPDINPSALRFIIELQGLIKQSKMVIKAIRAKDNSNLLRQQTVELNLLLNQITQQKSALLGDLELNPKALTSPDKRLEVIINRAQEIGRVGQEYQQISKYKNLDYKPHYYYYNIDLLNNYNRTGDGLATLLNKIIEQYGVYWLHEHEMPHMFEVLYPDIPEYEPYQETNLDPEKIIAEALKAKALKDSLLQVRTDSIAQAKEDSIALAQHIADSIEYRQNNPQKGDMNLTGFADNNLVFLLDVSSSMSNDTNKLPLLKEALGELIDLMRPKDKITLITYSGKAQIILPPTLAQSDADKQRIMSAIDGLISEGASDADQGLKMAYSTINKHLIENGNNRIILATDGGINVNSTTKNLIKKNKKHKNVRLSVFYFSKKEYSYHKQLLQELTDAGSGKYSYIQPQNAKKILVIEAQEVRQNKDSSSSENKG